MKSRILAEIRRLAHGPDSNEKPKGAGTVRFVVRCPLGSDSVMVKSKEVLRVLAEKILIEGTNERDWAASLPAWFKDACVPEMTPEEAQLWIGHWRSLPPAEQAREEAEKEWSLENWLYWMRPENRQWFWWDAKSIGDLDHILVAVEVEAWPFPWGALRWLFKAAGASAVEAEQ